MNPTTPNWKPCAILHEAILLIALASIPVSATIIHPALGMAAALAVVLALQNAKRTNGG